MSVAQWYTIFGILYLGVMVYIGYISNKKIVGGDDDYVLGGRKVPAILIAASVVSTWVAPGAMVAYTGMGNSIGLAGYWSGGAFMIATVWVGWWIIPRLRKLNVTTIPEIFEKYFGRSHRYAALILVLGRDLGMAANVITTMAIMFAFIYAIGFLPSMLITLGLVVAYTIIGGVWAVMYSDLFQAIILVIGTVIVIPLSIARIGGLSATVAAIPSTHVDLMNAGITQSAAWFITAVLITIGYQTMLQRGLAAESDDAARKGFAIGGLILTFWFMVPFVLGILGKILYPEVAGTEVYLHMIRAMFAAIPGAFFYIALLAAAMGSIDSLLVTLSSNIANDLYKPLLRPNLTGKDLILTQRIGVVITAVIAATIGYNFPMLLELCWMAARFMASALSPVIVGLCFFPMVRKCKITVMAVFLVVSAIVLRASLIPPTDVADTAFVWAIDPVLQGAPVAVVMLIVGTLIETRYLEKKQGLAAKS